MDRRVCLHVRFVQNFTTKRQVLKHATQISEALRRVGWCYNIYNIICKLRLYRND